jgi:uncharacterized protein (DUF433 family)
VARDGPLWARSCDVAGRVAVKCGASTRALLIVPGRATSLLSALFNRTRRARRRHARVISHAPCDASRYLQRVNSEREPEPRFEEWKAQLVTDDAILGGEPVFPKSRLAVRHVGQMLLRGASRDEVQEDYPYLSDRDLDFAEICAQATPAR